MSSPRGRLIPETGFVFDAAPGSNLIIGGQRNIAAPQLFKSKEFNFEKLGIGGLDSQFDQIFRRAFASRVLPPGVVDRMGIRHVKGVLLHGPPGTGAIPGPPSQSPGRIWCDRHQTTCTAALPSPGPPAVQPRTRCGTPCASLLPGRPLLLGCSALASEPLRLALAGKTLIARQIGKMLNGREPKIVNGPEVLNKYVGQSEENVRKLFAEAEADQLSMGENSDLHVIIFDEIDAICKARGSVRC